METWLSERSRHGGADELDIPGCEGRLWLAGKHLIAPDPIAALEATGTDRIVCLCQREELLPRYEAYVDWLDAVDDRLGAWRPVHDLHAPELDEAQRLLAELSDDLDQGRGLLIHCGAGIGRAGTIAAGIMIWRGWTLDEALHLVASSRPMAGPEAGAQTALLEALADR